MEILVFLFAFFGAVFDAFALAINLEDVALVAKLTNANLQTALVFVFVRKLGRANLHNDNFADKLSVVEVHGGAHKAFQGSPREVHSRIILNFTFVC